MKRRCKILIACTLAAACVSGCVRTSTYEAVIKETEVTKAEQHVTNAEKETLAQQVKELEKINNDMMTNVERTLEEVQRVQRDGETQKREAEANYRRLNQRSAQLVNQQAILRRELGMEKQSAATLNDQVEVYQRKLREASAAGAPETRIAEAERVAAPFDPLNVPVPEVLPDPTPPPVQQPVPAATPPLEKPVEKPVAEPVKSSEPTEAGWFSTITEWVLSVWRSLF